MSYAAGIVLRTDGSVPAAAAPVAGVLLLLTVVGLTATVSSIRRTLA